MVCPKYESKHPGSVIAYFPKPILKSQKFTKLSGTMQIAIADFDQVVFKNPNNDTKKSPLGVYKIKRDQSSQQPKFTIEFPIPKALRKALAPPQMGQIPNMRGRMMAMSQIPQLLKAEFIGSDGNLYQPNTTGAASGPIQRFSSSKSQSFSSPDGRSKGNSRTIRSGGSSQKADSRALEFGFNGLPAGVNIVEVRAIVSEPTKSTKSVDFQFKDVQLR